MRTHKRWSIVLGLTLATTGSGSAERSEQEEWIGGAVIEDASGAKATVDVYLDSGHNGKVIVGPSSGAAVHFIDPDPNDGWTLVFHECYVNGTQDNSIVAIATPAPEKEILEEIYYAWRIYSLNQTITAIPARSITCRNESFGANDE